MFPEHYAAWRSILNRQGLFDDPGLATAYTAAYEEAVLLDRSEPLAPPSVGGYEVITIEVGRVRI
jgi:hypothetical protein